MKLDLGVLDLRGEEVEDGDASVKDGVINIHYSDKKDLQVLASLLG